MSAIVAPASSSSSPRILRFENLNLLFSRLLVGRHAAHCKLSTLLLDIGQTNVRQFTVALACALPYKLSNHSFGFCVITRRASPVTARGSGKQVVHPRRLGMERRQ